MNLLPVSAPPAPQQFVEFDPEKAWRESVEAGRAADPMLKDSQLLNETRVLVAAAEAAGKFQARPRALKYSAEWWKQWKKVTPMGSPSPEGRDTEEALAELRKERRAAAVATGRHPSEGEATPLSIGLVRSMSSGALEKTSTTSTTAAAAAAAVGTSSPERTREEKFPAPSPVSLAYQNGDGTVSSRVASSLAAGGAGLTSAAGNKTSAPPPQQRQRQRRKGSTQGFVGAPSVSRETRAARTMLALELRAEETSIIPRADVSRGGSRRRHGRAADFSRDTSHDAPVVVSDGGGSSGGGGGGGGGGLAKQVMIPTSMSLDLLHDMSVEELLDQKHRTAAVGKECEVVEEGEGSKVALRRRGEEATRSTDPQQQQPQQPRRPARQVRDGSAAAIVEPRRLDDPGQGRFPTDDDDHHHHHHRGVAVAADRALISKAAAASSPSSSLAAAAAARAEEADGSRTALSAPVRQPKAAAVEATMGPLPVQRQPKLDQRQPQEEEKEREEMEKESSSEFRHGRRSQTRGGLGRARPHRQPVNLEDRTPKASVVFGQATRVFGAASHDMARSPGPVYHPTLDFTKTREGTVKFAMSKRPGSGGGSGGGGGDDGPAPGTYAVPSSIGGSNARSVNLGGGARRPWDEAAKKRRLEDEALKEIAEDKEALEVARAEAQALGLPFDDEAHRQQQLQQRQFDFSYAAAAAAESRPSSRLIGGGGGKEEDDDEEEEEKEEEAYPYRTFGFGCSLEEHVLYGQCLDGKCCGRSHVEQVMHRRVRRAKRRALRSRDARRRAALTKELANREKTNLHFACQHGKLDIVHQLCLHGAKVSAHDEAGHTPLMLASGGGHTRIVQRLLANAAYPHVTKLGFVSRRQGPACNSVDDGGRTALHHAAEGGHHVIVKLLLEAGANAEVQDKKRTTALDVCTSPEAFHLLRSRAELYARRERLEGVALKRNLIESANEVQVRRNTKVLAKNLQGDVRALRTATAVLAERVARADDDVLGYESTGKLHFRTGDLAADATLSGERLVDICRGHAGRRRHHGGGGADDDGKADPAADVIRELGVERYDKKKKKKKRRSASVRPGKGKQQQQQQQQTTTTTTKTRHGNAGTRGGDIRARLEDISFESSSHVTTESTTLLSGSIDQLPSVVA